MSLTLYESLSIDMKYSGFFLLLRQLPRLSYAKLKYLLNGMAINDHDNQKLILVQDGGGKYKGMHQVMSSTATITVNVVDAQDMPPSFVGTPYFGYIYEVSLPVSRQPLQHIT